MELLNKSNERFSVTINPNHRFYLVGRRIRHCFSHLNTGGAPEPVAKPVTAGVFGDYFAVIFSIRRSFSFGFGFGFGFGFN